MFTYRYIIVFYNSPFVTIFRPPIEVKDCDKLSSLFFSMDKQNFHCGGLNSSLTYFLRTSCTFEQMKN